MEAHLIDRQPAEVFPPGEFIQEELDARGWTTADLAARMGGDAGINKLTVDLLILVPSKNMLLGEETAHGLAKAFGVSSQFFLNIDAAWQKGATDG